ncbi:uncharacterized protein [Periplaneta americana]|uniref:uncharacterized protein n=1 Tax=Periplaneta americana TaxID=6978 RepID=UPI0037E7DB68
MRTSLLIFVLGAFVPFFFVEVASDTISDSEELGDQLADLTQKVIGETKDSGVKAQLTQTRSYLLEDVDQWKLRVERGMKSVKTYYGYVKKGTSPFIDAASAQNKAALEKVLKGMDEVNQEVRRIRLKL